MNTVGISGRRFSLFLTLLAGLTFVRADGVFDYSDGENNPSPLVLAAGYYDFNMPSGAAVQSGAVSSCTPGVFLSKYGVGTLMFSGVLDLDGYLYVTEGVMVSSAAGSFVNYLSVDNTDPLPATSELHVSGGTLRVNAIYVGTYGSGSLQVTGGLLDNSATAANFGYFAGSAGNLSVTGPGAEFRSEELKLGTDGAGSATVSGGGLIAATGGSRHILLGENSGGHGTLNIGAAADGPAAVAGVVDAARVIGGEGGGVVVFNHTGDFFFTTTGDHTGQAVLLEGNVQLITASGTTVLTGANTHTAGTLVLGGRLVLSDVGEGSVLGSGAVTVGEDGTLAGSGKIHGAATVAGKLDPGESAGVMIFEGGLTLDSAASIRMELGGLDPAGFDRLVMEGELIYGGTLRISFLDSFVPQVADSFQLFSGFSTQSGSFAEIETGAPGYEAIFDYETGTLTFTAVPEPGVIGLVALGMGGALLATRRRR